MRTRRTLVEVGAALFLSSLLVACSGGGAASSASSSASLPAPQTCTEFLALSSDQQRQVSPDSGLHAQYEDNGVKAEVAYQIYREMCPSQDGATKLAPSSRFGSRRRARHVAVS